MATGLGRTAKVFTGAGSPPANLLDLAMDPKVRQTPTIEDVTTNDTGRGVNRENIRIDYELTVNCFADPLSTGQNNLRTAFKNGTKVFVIYQEQGTLSGLPQDLGLFVVSDISRGSPKDGRNTVDFTLQIDGLIDDTVQA